MESTVSSKYRRLGRSVVLAAIVVTLGQADLLRPASATACDICAIYSATDLIESRTGVRLGFAEQYTQFTTEQRDGEEVPNIYGEHLYSSNTQLFAGYQFNQRFGIQLNVPILYRNWRRVLEDGDIQESTRAGIGDIALIGNFRVFDAIWDNSIFRFGVLGGLKFPTGNPHFLGEELEEQDGEEEEEGDHHGDGTEQVAHDGEFHSGVHGHDLAFGSGSVDGVVGGDLYWSFHRFFMTAAAQYKVTTEGAFDYQFANDLTWYGGPGYYILLDHGYSFSAQAVFTGETKGFDTQQGETLTDTAITALYLGPGLDLTWEGKLTAEVGADLPVVQNNTDLQIVPDFRMRAAVVWRF